MGVPKTREKKSQPLGMTKKERATVLQRVVAGPRRFSSPSVGRGPMTTQDDGLVGVLKSILVGCTTKVTGSQDDK